VLAPRARWTTAALSCGPGAALDHHTAGTTATRSDLEELFLGICVKPPRKRPAA